MWTVSPDDRRRDMSSKAAVVFPVPVSPFTRRSSVFRSSNFCNSGGKGISGDAPRSSFNIRPPNWREEETWAAIYHGCVLRCVLLCSPKVNWVARSIRWRTERKKSSDDARFSDARRRGTRRIGPSAPRRTDSDLPCCFTSNVAKGGRGHVRYVYAVIEAHAVRYKERVTGREFGCTDSRAGRTSFASPPSAEARERRIIRLSRNEMCTCVYMTAIYPQTVRSRDEAASESRPSWLP